MTSDGGYHQSAGAVAFGGHNNAAPAQFTVGEIGFGPAWSDGLYEQIREAGVCTACGMADSMAASIIRLEQENQELRAEVALAEAERIEMAKMLRSEREAHAKCQNQLDAYRDAACAESCRDKEAADRAGGNLWSNI